MAAETHEKVLKIAVKTPLYRLFDYLPPVGLCAEEVAVGARVRVPFGTRQIIGVVWEPAGPSALPRSRLRQASAVIDRIPVLGPDLMRLLHFASEYYLHAPGEVCAAALPNALRKGSPVIGRTEALRLCAGVDAARVETDAGRAPRQAALLQHLVLAGPEGVTYAELDDAVKNWRNVRAAVIAKDLAEVFEREEGDPTLALTDPVAGPALSAPQATATEAVIASLERFSVTLLDGVTGSGKTEVYLRLIDAARELGLQSLILAPEIGLTPQLIQRFRERLGEEPALLHSGLTDTERLAAWRRARSGNASVIVGTRSAIFCPLARPGLIVVDEEHDASLKQQDGFRYSARDLAVARARDLAIPVVLGSATPSFESLANVVDERYSAALLPRRAGAAKPPRLRLIDLNASGLNDGLSRPLLDAIDVHLHNRGQALIYLNRRGFAPTLVCEACGHIVECQRCDARMTLHAASQRLICHHCGATEGARADCGVCNARLKPLGEGTERIHDALLRYFPGRKVVRIDSDTTRRKGAFASALRAAQSGEAEILVGTQMLSKGHHFPKLTLVGIVNADQGLFGSDFRSTERLAQSLLQVAGRAGREAVEGDVLIQTAFPEHPLLNTLLTSGYRAFAHAALKERREAGWPPFARLALLRAQARRRQDAWAFLEELRATALSLGVPGVDIYGPVRAVMERRAGLYRSQLLFRGRGRGALRQFLKRLRPLIDERHASGRLRWSLDVDPVDLI